MEAALRKWQDSLAASVAGKDYPKGAVNPGQPEPTQWNELEIYRPYFEQWKNRPEYESRLKSQTSKSK